MRNVEAIAAHQVPRLLRGWLDDEAVEVAAGSGDLGFDLQVRGSGLTFFIEVMGTDDVAQVEKAARHLEAYANGRGHTVGLLVTPFMGPKAREYAHQRGLCWLDLSGNADIWGPGLRILIEGKPNRFASPGRPSTAFSDKAARLTRVMLIEPERWWRQHELVEATDLSAGYVSKVVSRLREDGLVDDDPAARALRPRSPDVLLDAWAQVYDFRRHEIARYHAVGRTGPAIAETLAKHLAEQAELRWAATGLTAAWRVGKFADHRLVTYFVSAPPTNVEALGLRPVDRGENVWLVVPRDHGVFYGAEEMSGLRCVHPVQIWLDLLGHPERAAEAAQDLQAHYLPWSRS